MVPDMYCSDDGCKKAICLDCIDAHRCHALCKLSKVTDEMAGTLREKVKELSAHDAAITAGIGKVKLAMAACDISTAACVVGISAAAQAQHAEVTGAPTPLAVPRNPLQGSRTLHARYSYALLSQPVLDANKLRSQPVLHVNKLRSQPMKNTNMMRSQPMKPRSCGKWQRWNTRPCSAGRTSTCH